MKPSLLARLREAPGTLGPFALLVRFRKGSTPLLEIFCGTIIEYESLNEIPLPPENHTGAWMLGIVPYCQIRERGYACADDKEPLQVMQIDEMEQVELHQALENWPNTSVGIREGHFDIDDKDYAEIVKRIVANEISNGEGSNFVIKRTYMARIEKYSIASALTAFKNLVQQEREAYWTFLIHTGKRTWIGASPEQHVALDNGVVNMNPISGTYRYQQNGATLSGLLDFLNDKKETDELYMVVDEELKMMSRFCKEGARVIGPHLRFMSRLAHTEYVLEGRSNADPRIILKETLFSPAVTGSPVQNACRIIARYEPQGRRYYAGVLALFGRSEQSTLLLDSAIMIRTADIDCTGHIKISVGATIVRHSEPSSEALETRAKAISVINAFSRPTPEDLGDTPEIIAALQQRNTGISEFWLADFKTRNMLNEQLAQRELLIVDAEDSFTEMLGHQLRALGLKVAVTGVDGQRILYGNWDVVLFGPGPGDPGDLSDARINTLRSALRQALVSGKAFMAVCLSHQLLCLELNIPNVQLQQPNQGVQHQINYFGKSEKVGFYNTFCAKYHENRLSHGGKIIEVSRNTETQEVYALRGPGFISTQFHPESILTQNGSTLLLQALLHVTSR